MPLNKDALPLEPTPASVTSARRWVATVCKELGREDLIDCSELGVSELVTNAILHGSAPIRVSVRGTVQHPRIEVWDSSRRAPTLPSEPLHESFDEDDIDSFLATNGRGLSIVAMASDAWGASIEETGKIVWFEPAGTVHDDSPEGVITGLEDVVWNPPADAFTVRLLGLDVALFQSMLTQYNNLRRELRLLAISHDNDYPLAADLSQIFATFERQLPPSSLAVADALLREGGDNADLVFAASPASVQIFRTMLDMFELADAFCRTQRLLSLARSPEMVALQRWLLEEFIRQCEGRVPAPWPGVDAVLGSTAS